ncbi:MAG: hemolysin family protein [Lachnospiraceae bacterium]|nr:HlyC/CorC family transporter [Lachnospiraceae bacterium]MCR5337037.1 hemolysin family protein [Lachnospiraceae bacterium]
MFKGKKSKAQSEEEIISMVDEGSEQGVLLENEAEMIHNIFAFSDKCASDIMTHRSEIVALDADMSLKAAYDFMLQSHNTRFPVYVGDLDHIIGLVHFKDACRLLSAGRNDKKSVRSAPGLIREVRFIPETRKLSNLFEAMQKTKTHLVMVIDEYGQTAGLVAMEDILEEIVGEILDEYDEDEDQITEKGQDRYEIDGLTPLDELGKRLGITFEIEEIETLNGLMTANAGHIPEEDEIIEMDYGGYHFKSLSIAGRVIREVEVTKSGDGDFD